MVWNGTKLSEAAARPPPPRHLADPAAFAMLDLADTAALRVTKRDCRTWFDQLAVSDELGSFFARPAITRGELNISGMCDDEILALGGDALSSSFYPCYKVWPMGFAWSSCVAQDTLLGVCSRSGLTESFNPDKDVNDGLNSTCVGVDLVNGTSWSPPGKRIWKLLDALLD